MKKAVTVKLIGGLGNQMFQYAAALALAKKNGIDDVYLDTSAFETYKKWPYHLQNFDIQQNFKNNKSSRLLKKIFKILGIKTAQYVEPHFHFDEKFLTLKAPVHLEGYFQSPRYFQEIKEVIFDKFVSKKELSQSTQKLLKKIQASENSVSIHIRRGDYITDKGASTVHKTLPIEYYKKAVQEIYTIVSKDAEFFIFSDDTDFIKENFDFCENKTIVEGDISNPIEDIVLMSACKNNIIANSTFSWWGAWLNRNESKKVIAPKAWFSKEMMQKTNVNDLYPKDWILI